MLIVVIPKKGISQYEEISGFFVREIRGGKEALSGGGSNEG